jgi:bifunctional non-homologous end joining protein LigD
MASDSPGLYVANMAKNKRSGKIFVDYLRNGRGATAVAAYSTRARDGATVSTPLRWDELSDAVRSAHFRISNVGRRLKNMKSDPWAGFFEATQRAWVSGASRGKKPRGDR